MKQQPAALVPRPRRKPPSQVPELEQESEALAEAQQIEARKKRSKNSKLADRLRKVRSIPELLRLFKIRECNWLLIGDGSCTGDWKYESGWACTAINVHTGERQELHGGANIGTNILSEMTAYTYPFCWLARKKEQLVMYVDVFTDCEYVVQAAQNPQRRKAYREVWHMVDAYKRSGMIIRWHWIPRDILALNQFAHTLANMARVAMKGLGDEALESLSAESVHEFTPNQTGA